MIRLGIAEDHGVVRAGLAELVQTFEGIELVATAADGAEAVDRFRELKPDVVLMDLEMPRLDGIEATKQVLRHSPETRVVVLTSFSDQARIVRALDAGAVGYMLKDAAPEDLAEAIRTAARDESPLDPKAARALLAARWEPAPDEKLSDREREVLAMVASGLPNKLISRRLGISEKTVKTHLTSIFRQLGVTDRTQAALWAERHGLTH